MAKCGRLIKTFTNEERRTTVKVYYNSQWREYICRLTVCNTLFPNGDYFTDDKEDALTTAELMAIE